MCNLKLGFKALVIWHYKTFCLRKNCTFARMAGWAVHVYWMVCGWMCRLTGRNPGHGGLTVHLAWMDTAPEICIRPDWTDGISRENNYYLQWATTIG